MLVEPLDEFALGQVDRGLGPAAGDLPFRGGLAGRFNRLRLPRRGGQVSPP